LEGVDWIYFIQDRDQWLAGFNMFMNSQAAYKARKLLTAELLLLSSEGLFSMYLVR
jgi:hypothetical protein